MNHVPRLRIIYRNHSSNSSSNPTTDQKGYNDQHDRGNQSIDLLSSILFFNSIWWHNVECCPWYRRIILRLCLLVNNLFLPLRLRSTSLIPLYLGQYSETDLLIYRRDNFRHLTRYS